MNGMDVFPYRGLESVLWRFEAVDYYWPCGVFRECEYNFG